MTVEDIKKAYVEIRKSNHTIPDEVLDFMKDSAIQSLNSIICPECGLALGEGIESWCRTCAIENGVIKL